MFRSVKAVFLIMIMSVILFTGCSAGGDGSSSGGSDDPSERFYNCTVMRLDLCGNDAWNYTLFDKGDGCAVVAPMVSLTDDDKGLFYIVNNEGIVSSFTVEGSWGEASFAALDEDRFIMSDYDCPYRICDYEGNILEESDPSSDLWDYSGNVAVTGDYIAIGNANGVAVLDRDMNRLGIIDVNAGDTLMELNGEIYAVDGFSIYRLDIPNMTAEFKAFADDFELPDQGNGVRNYKYYESRYNGMIYEADIENKTLIPIADFNNILEYQGVTQFQNNALRNVEVIDRDLFYRVFDYQWQDYMEVALYYYDPDLDMSDREVITVGGIGCALDTDLHRIVYDYNISQDKYWVKIEELAPGCDWSIPEQATAANLELMASFQRGESPDIFYGDQFDYEYMGENDMVIDIKPYLDATDSFDPSVLTENIYDLMSDDECIYQVFAGYGLEGYFGDDSQYPIPDVSIFNMPELVEGQERFSMSFSTRIAYNIFALDLKNIYRRGDLSVDVVTDLLRLALSEGLSESEYWSIIAAHGYQDFDQGNVSLTDTSIFNINNYYDMCSGSEEGVMPMWIGYPSIDGSVHAVYPVCQMAVSSGASDPEACCEFVSAIFSSDFQRNIASGGIIPVNDDILREMLGVVSAPETLTDDLSIYYTKHLIRYYPDPYVDSFEILPMDQDVIDSFLQMISYADQVVLYDWGVEAIINEEIDSYRDTGKSIEEAAQALYSRLLIYAQENY